MQGIVIMGNFKETREELKNYILARTPLIIIETSERERAERMLLSICKELTTDMYYYTETKQVIKIGSSTSNSIDVANDPLLFIADIFKKKNNVIFGYGDISRISEDSIFSREIINILYSAVERNSTLILITKDTVYPRIAQFGMITKLDYPTLEERCEQISNFIKPYSSRYNIEWDNKDITVAATLLSGFSEIQINNILSNELITSKGLYKDNIHNLTLQKSKLYGTVSNVQSIKLKPNLNVAGLDNLKKWLDEKKNIFFATDDELGAFGLNAPKGILLAGVPGCGKSLSAKMIAQRWGLPLFRFDVGSIYDKYMGESERKMKDALEFIDNVAPCVLWVDEIEKALSVSGGESDTGKRIMGQLLFWLQESASRVFLVATANNVDLLPPELFRKGRFSEIFFVDLPSEIERKEVIKMYASQCLQLTFREEQLKKLVDISKGFSYSEIEYAIKESAQIIFLYGRNNISFETIKEKFERIVPIEKSRAEDIKKVRQWGKEKAVPAFLTNKESDN